MLHAAIIATRTDDGSPDTTEIRRLTEAAGARVLGELTQQRPPDPGTYFGSGKVEELAELVAETGADTVVVDAALTPQQTVSLEDETGAIVVDRYRVVLEIFAEQAHTRRAQLQTELARLRYRLPRIRETDDPQRMNIALEKGTRTIQIRERIDELERKLDTLPAVDEQHRDARREEGFDLVAIAGYTNAGKTTLLRRLADDLSLEATRARDETEIAGVANHLFKTLETRTRRATLDGRGVLLTDTVGFLDDLPHWLVDSFRGTLREIEAADVVVLVIDLAQPLPEIRRKLETTKDAIPPETPVVTALNKIDRLDPAEQAERCEALGDTVSHPVRISATEGDLEDLVGAILDRLPSLEEHEMRLPLSDEAMSLVSWIHDEATEASVAYGPDETTVTFKAKGPTVQKAQAKAADVVEQ